MFRSLFFPAFVLAIAFAFSSGTVANADGHEKKGEEQHALKSVSCDPACGFSVRSHDEAEIVDIVKVHAKAHHQMELTDQKVKEMMKPVDGKKMKMEKKEKKDKGM